MLDRDAEPASTARGRYDHLSPAELVALLEKRDRKEARIGLQWSADAAERDTRLNSDFAALRLDPDLCDGDAPWPNLVIEGDNFDALRWLRMTMARRVRCIFVDPPYNTGTKDWVYNDAYRDPGDPFHDTTWLQFLYERFCLARDLLSENGVLFCCINDEKRALVELMLEQAMPGMRIGSLVWRTRAGTKGGGAFISGDHEHILVFGNPQFRFDGNLADVTKYTNDDDDPRGAWTSVALQTNKSYKVRPNSYQPVLNPRTGHWHPCNPNRVWSFQMRGQISARGPTFEDLLDDDLVLFSKEGQYDLYDTRADLDAAIIDGTAHSYLRADLPDLDFWVGKPIARGSVRKKQFLVDPKGQRKPFSSWIAGLSESVEAEDAITLRSGTYSEGTGQLRKLMGADVFPNPKPTSLVRELIRQSTGFNDIVLDFFAGSGTTAQAVMELNTEDDAGRRFVMVSHDEATEDDPDRNLARDVLAKRIQLLNEGAGPRPVEAASFAYLRTQLVPAARLMDLDPEGDGPDLFPSDVWIAVQTMHDRPLTPFDPDAPIHLSDDGDGVVAFVDRMSQAAIDTLEAVARRGVPIHCYAWTPGPVRRALDGADLELHRLPGALWDRFAS